MKAIHLFYLGAGIDALLLLLSLSGILTMSSDSQGMTSIGRILLWLIPLIVLVLIALAFWLKSAGKIVLANILLWIPALPVAGGILLWGGLAILFILFGK